VILLDVNLLLCALNFKIVQDGWNECRRHQLIHRLVARARIYCAGAAEASLGVSVADGSESAAASEPESDEEDV
jgi:hypothetical protein